MASDENQRDVNAFRRCKRFVRRKVGWNGLPMRYQLRVHLFSLFGTFFIIYFLFMYIYTKVQYVSELVNIVSDQLKPILEDRLVYSTQAVATTFYMIDKLGIDSTLRLSGMYKRTESYQPFPIRADADGYQLYQQSDFNGKTDKRIYNAGVSCSNGLPAAPANGDPLKQLKHIWEQSVLMGIGNNREVNAERVLFFFENTVCAYPAQNFDNFKYNANTWKSADFWAYPYQSDDMNNYMIERNAADYFGGLGQVDPVTADVDGERFVTFYSPINPLNKAEGIIGLQLNQKDYNQLVPSTVLEQPYELSFIAVFDAESDQLIWNQTVETNTNQTIYMDEILDKIKSQRYFQRPALAKNSLPILDTFAHNLTISNEEEYFNTWEVPSPLNGITKHKNYNSNNAMYVVCGQRGKLYVTIEENLEQFIDDDLFWF